MSFFSKKPAAEPQNIDEILLSFKELRQECESLKQEVEKLRQENLQKLGKVGIIRFNPFDGLGGNQSFSLAVLDGNGSGAVITSMFSRDANRVYGKPVENGQSEFKLTDEEKQAICIALGKNHK